MAIIFMHNLPSAVVTTCYIWPAYLKPSDAGAGMTCAHGRSRHVRVVSCSPSASPRAPPLCPPSNQSTERPIGSRDHGAGSSRERSEETVGEGHVCTHCRAAQPSSSSKNWTDGPFPEQASSEKFIGEERFNRKPVLTVLFSGFKVLGARRESQKAHFRMSVCQMKRPRNASGNATSKHYASVGLSPCQMCTFLVSLSGLSAIFVHKCDRFALDFLLTVLRRWFPPLEVTKSEKIVVQTVAAE